MACSPRARAARVGCADRRRHATLRAPIAHRLVTGLQGGSGSTIGPDRALYVTESAAGRITRVDPKTGATTPTPAVCRVDPRGRLRWAGRRRLPRPDRV